MKTQAELWADYDRALAQEDYEAALRILDDIEPISDEEFRRKLDAAPMDDEPVSEELLARFEAFDAALARQSKRRVG